ncbi:MAG: hypothetical protein HY363_01630 [Candidatus Aenigmarchaeota archaeon]|nr:hypothetical protein [Candidatus Aenigmarchaeota archaeon]
MVDGFKRSSATRLWVEDLLSGKLSAAGEFGKDSVYRVALCGVVVGVENGEFRLDDGTGVLTLRAFDSFGAIVLGTAVMCIGRPRVFMNAVYVLIEILKPLSDVRWLEVWKRIVPRTDVPQMSSTGAVLELIRKNDSEGGADVEKIVKSGIPDGETLIADLLLKGVIFEVSPGRVKVLD